MPLQLLAPDTVARCEEKFIELFREGFRFGKVSAIRIHMDLPFLDESGGLSLEKGLEARMSRSTAEGVDWEALAPGDLPGICDEWWQDDRIE